MYVLVLVQMAVSLGTMVLMFYLSCRLFGFQGAFLALILMAVDPTSSISANHLLPETLFSFLLSACLVGLMHTRNQPSSNLINISLVGIGFSVLALCRPIGFLLFVVVAFWLYVT